MFADEHPWWRCNIHVTVLLLVFAVGMIQISRQIGHLVGFAYASIGLILVQTVAMLIYVSTTPSPAIPNSQELAFGQGDHERNTWYNLFGALGVFIYSCLPGCIVVETMAEMKDPTEIKAAVRTSFCFYLFIYLITGLPVVIAWGGDVVLPVTEQIRGTSFTPVLINMILMYSTLLDFVIAATTVNRFVVARIDPGFSYAWTWSNSGKWALYTLPVTALAFSMALFVPKLESLTGLLNSVAGTTLQITGPALCLYFCTDKSLPKQSNALLLAAAAFGATLTVIIFVETVYSVGWLTSYSSGSFWCDVVGR
jgi:hypothetical protein